MKKVAKALVTSVLAFAASASQAAFVEKWDFVIDMSWNTAMTVFTPVPYSPGYYTTPYGVAWLDRGRTFKSPTELSWGSNLSGARYSHPSYLYARSGLVIDKQRTPGSVATTIEGQTPIVASGKMFTHHNGEISPIADLLTRTQLNMTVELTPSGSNTLAVKIPQKFDVYFLETPNEGKRNCTYSFNCDDDIFVIVPNLGFTSVFNHDGIDYTLNFFENNTIKQFDAATCKKVMLGAYTGQNCFGFTTSEHGSTDIRFNLSITAVPEPEAYAMLLAGLGMIGVVVRRRKIRH